MYILKGIIKSYSGFNPITQLFVTSDKTFYNKYILLPPDIELKKDIILIYLSSFLNTPLENITIADNISLD